MLSMTTAFVFLFACRQRTDHSKEISRLDSASEILTCTGKILLSLDTNSLRNSYNASAGQLHSIREKLAKDTVKKKMAMFLSDAYEQSANIRNLLGNKKYLERAVSEYMQRINDLKHDLSEDLIEKNKTAGYIVNEIDAAGKIFDAVNKSIEKAKTASTKLDSLKTEIIFLADSIKSK